MTDGQPKHFIVVVPGYMGSLLRDPDSGKIVWLDIPGLLKNPFKIGQAVDELLDKMTYPDGKLEPAGIMDQLLFVPPWAKQEHYGRLLDVLEGWGYEIDPENPGADDLVAYTFSYDWRQDNRISGRQLGEAIAGWVDRHNGAEAWIIGHSNGGIVSRWYIEKEGGKQHVKRLFLMGSPWDGSPKTIKVLRDGLDVLGIKRLNAFGMAERMGDLIRSFPSFYQIIPHANPFLRDSHNQVVNLFENTGWLDEPVQREYLADALKFNQELGTTPSVETICFFGRQKPTVTTGIVEMVGDKLGEIQWVETGAGDGTVPEESAVHPKADEVYAFALDHGSIYVDPQMQPQLEWELIGKYGIEERAILLTERLMIQFEPGRDTYQPSESLDLWATVHTLDDEGEASVAVNNARVVVHMIWREALPGSDAGAPAGDPPTTTLEASAVEDGRYEGTLQAPDQEGYYRLQASVFVPGEQPLQLNELVLVESE